MSIKVAIVGAGEVVKNVHLPSWREMRDVDVAAICDINEDAARSVASCWKIPRYYAQFEELLDCEKPFLVDICTPPTTHPALVVQALEAGCNILLEKPLAVTIEESDQIIRAYRQRKDKRLKLGVIHNFLFCPPILNMYAKVKRGEIGDIIGVEIKAFSTQNDPLLSDPEHWCHSLPGGRYGEGLIHLVYLLYHFLGALEIRSLWVAKRGSYPWVDYDELFITFSAGGRFGSIYNSFNSPVDNAPVITIYGTKSQLEFESYDWTILTRRSVSNGAFNKAMNILHEIYQLSRSLGINTFNKTIAGRTKTGHSIYFPLFIDSIVNGKELPLDPEEAYEANRVFLEVISELEKARTEKLNQS